METLLAKELNIEVKDKDIENIEDLGSAVDGLSKIDQAENCVNFQVQPADNLKNGDKITVKSIMNNIYIPHLKWGPRQSRSVT